MKVPCLGCHYPDGILNTELMDREGSCIFGCGRHIDNDYKYCSHCEAHSANQYECSICNSEYQNWGGPWVLQYVNGMRP